MQAFAVVICPLSNPQLQFGLKHFAADKEAVWRELREGYKFVACDEEGQPTTIVDLEGTLVVVHDWVTWESNRAKVPTRIVVPTPQVR